MTDAEAREMARELVRGSIAEDAVSQFIAQIIKHTHDERVRPLRRKVADLEAKLAKAEKAIKSRIHWSAGGLYCNCGECDALVATLAEIKGESRNGQ